jgi:cancer susceptibility candidate protein 1
MLKEVIHYSLPDSVSWFEPPIVCRFESEEEFQEVKLLEAEMKKKIRKDDDELDDAEEEVEVNEQEEKKENVVRKPAKERKIKIVEDFNLLDIPKKINLKPLFEEFVIPMLPDGYEIKFEPKKTYDLGRRNFKDKIYTIDDVVYQTRQPRSLFPHCGTKKILKVVKNRSRFELSPGLEFSSDEENDESMYSVDSDQSGGSGCVYMFSKFMRDLEDLIDMENPTFERKIAEMSSNLSMASEADKSVDRKDSGVSLTKTNSKSLLDVSDEGDSDAESDTDNEEQEDEYTNNTMIDTMVKETNIKRCFGRWSTRDIHDVKFNEDKLTIQFRSGRLGSFAFASNRYSNFPYQSWECKPEFKM